MTYTCKGTLFSHKNEGAPMACNNMNEPEGHYENWNMPVSKGQLLHNSIYEVSKKKNQRIVRDWEEELGVAIGQVYIFSYVMLLSYRDLLYNIAPIVNNNILCT